MRCAALTGVLCCCRMTVGQWIAIPLNPPGMWDSAVYAVSPSEQFGSAHLGDPPYTSLATAWQGSPLQWRSLTAGGRVCAVLGSARAGGVSGHAALWPDSLNQWVDLHPPGWTFSTVFALSGDRQFGTVTDQSTGSPHAAMWSGSAASFVDLNPPVTNFSGIVSAYGSQQGGGVMIGGWGHAALWSGTAQSFLDLHPGAAYSESGIMGMAEGQQVGFARPAGQFKRAAMWHGTAASYHSMDPPEAEGYSVMLATCASAQAGYIAPASGVYAGVWFGTPNSFHNLAQYLPPGAQESQATSIATDGFFYYVGGWAYYGYTVRNQAFLWTAPVPGACYPNCDQSTAPPVLNTQDFACFLTRFRSGALYANCDRSTAAPVLNVLDFMCFLNRFAAECP